MPNTQRSAIDEAGRSSEATGGSPPRQPAPDQPWREDEIDLSPYMRVLRRHWKLLAAGVLIGAVTGLGSALWRPTLYEAATTILVTHASTQGLGDYLATVQSNVSTSRALLENYTLAAETLNEIGLNRPPGGMTPHQFIEQALDIQEVPGTSLMKVTVRLRDPNQAAQASRILSQKAVELNRHLATDESTAIRGQLKAHLDAAAERLKTAEQQLLTYRDGAQIEVLKKDTDSMLGERGGLLKLLIDIEAEKGRLSSAEQEIQKQERVLSVGRSVRSEDALMRAAQASAARGSQAAAAGAVDPDFLDLSNPFINPVYQTLAFQIATSRTRLAALERERREMVVVRKLGESRFKKLSDLYSREIELGRLETSYDLAKRVYGDLGLKYELSRTESIGNRVQLQIVDEAFSPERPLSRRRIQWTALGLTAGLLFAGLAALALGNAGKTA